MSMPDAGQKHREGHQGDFPDTSLRARDVALLAYAEQVTRDVAKITENHIPRRLFER